MGCKAPPGWRYPGKSGQTMSQYYKDARATLAALAEGYSRDEYINLIWAQRYPHTTPAASTGWPVKRAHK